MVCTRSTACPQRTFCQSRVYFDKAYLGKDSNSLLDGDSCLRELELQAGDSNRVLRIQADKDLIEDFRFRDQILREAKERIL